MFQIEPALKWLQVVLMRALMKMQWLMKVITTLERITLRLLD